MMPTIRRDKIIVYAYEKRDFSMRMLKTQGKGESEVTFAQMRN